MHLSFLYSYFVPQRCWLRQQSLDWKTNSMLRRRHLVILHQEVFQCDGCWVPHKLPQYDFCDTCLWSLQHNYEHIKKTNIYPQYYSNRVPKLPNILCEKSNNIKSNTYVTFITPLRMWLRLTLKSMESNAVSELLSSSTITVRLRSYLGRRNWNIIQDMIHVALIYRF